MEPAQGGRADEEAQRVREKDVCTICLSPVTERAVAVPCNHLAFDFICLAQWLQNRATCPLCKSEVDEVQYDFRETWDFKRYLLHNKKSRAVEERERTGGGSHSSSAPASICEDERRESCIVENPALTFRRYVHEHKLYSLHVGSNRSSGYQDYAPATFSASRELQSRARAFLRRELRVFDSFAESTSTATASGSRLSSTRSSGRSTRRTRAPGATLDYMVEYVLTILRTQSPKSFDGRAEDLVAEFVGRDRARLLLHEIDAWLRSPFRRLEAWDQVVQYPANASAGRGGAMGEVNDHGTGQM